MSTQYRIPIEEKFSFQRPVLKQQSDPPASPAKGDRYIVAPTGTGAWSGHDKSIAWYTGSAWSFDAPAEGWLVYDAYTNYFFAYSGSAWSNLVNFIDLSGIAGDMLKSTYDTDNDGIVNKAESVDDGAGNSATAAQIKQAVTDDHTHSNKTTLDSIQEAFTTALKSNYDTAYSQTHTHSNKTTLDAIQEALTTALKGQYDEAYSRRLSYDADLGCLLTTI